MLTQRFEKAVFFPVSAAVAFRFHTRIDNMCCMLPEHVGVKIISAPEYVAAGDLVHLEVTLHSFTFKWRTSIVEYEKNRYFTDTLRHGPFALWKHVHLFEEKNGGVYMTDRIFYRVKFGIFAGFASHFFVRNELERIFTKRHEKALHFFSSK